MNDIKILLDLLKNGAFGGSDAAGEEVSTEYLTSLSTKLGHNIFPIKEIRNNGDTLYPEELQAINFNSELYLRDDKFMTILVPDSWNWNSPRINILDTDENLLCSLYEDKDFIYDYRQLDRDFTNIIQLKVHKDGKLSIGPQEIIIDINHEEEK